MSNKKLRVSSLEDFCEMFKYVKEDFENVVNVYEVLDVDPVNAGFVGVEFEDGSFGVWELYGTNVDINDLTFEEMHKRI